MRRPDIYIFLSEGYNPPRYFLRSLTSAKKKSSAPYSGKRTKNLAARFHPAPSNPLCWQKHPGNARDDWHSGTSRRETVPTPLHASLSVEVSIYQRLFSHQWPGSKAQEGARQWQLEEQRGTRNGAPSKPRDQSTACWCAGAGPMKPASPALTRDVQGSFSAPAAPKAIFTGHHGAAGDGGCPLGKVTRREGKGEGDTQPREGSKEEGREQQKDDVVGW